MRYKESLYRGFLRKTALITFQEKILRSFPIGLMHIVIETLHNSPDRLSPFFSCRRLALTVDAYIIQSYIFPFHFAQRSGIHPFECSRNPLNESWEWICWRRGFPFSSSTRQLVLVKVSVLVYNTVLHWWHGIYSIEKIYLWPLASRLAEALFTYLALGTERVAKIYFRFHPNLFRQSNVSYSVILRFVCFCACCYLSLRSGKTRSFHADISSSQCGMDDIHIKCDDNCFGNILVKKFSLKWENSLKILFLKPYPTKSLMQDAKHVISV